VPCATPPPETSVGVSSTQSPTGRTKRHTAWTIGCALAALSGFACASRQASPPIETGQTTDWLFSNRTIESLPEVETSSSGLAAIVPAPFQELEVIESNAKSQRATLAHPSGAKIAIEIALETYPGTVASVQEVLRRMQVPVESVPGQISTKMEYLSETAIAARSFVGTIEVHGLAWWRGGRLFFVRVTDVPKNRGELHEDLRRLIAALISANGG
jgi:hypothetical protein